MSARPICAGSYEPPVEPWHPAGDRGGSGSGACSVCGQERRIVLSALRGRPYSPDPKPQQGRETYIVTSHYPPKVTP